MTRRRRLTGEHHGFEGTGPVTAVKVWWLLLLLVPHAAGAPLYGINADGALLLTADVDDERHGANKHAGKAGASGVTWSLHSDPALLEAVHLNGTLNATAVFDSAAGGASVRVSMTLQSKSQTLATGGARDLTVVAGVQQITWQIPVVASIPPGPLWWNITADGPVYLGLQLRLQDGETRLDLPQVAFERRPVVTTQTLGSGPVSIAETGRGEHTITTYTWPRNETEAVFAWNTTVAAGRVAVTVLDGAGAILLETQWVEDAIGNQTLNGTLGQWRIIVERDDHEGRVALTAAAPRPPPEEPAPRARQTPAPLGVLGLALAAWIRNPRSAR